MSSPADPPLTAVVLAAGAGSRMRSAGTPKVLQAFAGSSLLGHVLRAVKATAPTRTCVVVGHLQAQVRDHLSVIAPDAIAVEQPGPHGTGHALRVALDALDVRTGTVLAVPGDAPLLRGATLRELVAGHRASGAAASMLTSEVVDPRGYGRVIRKSDAALSDLVSRVVEEADTTEAEHAITEVSALVYAFDAELVRTALARLGTDNVAGEELLPDVVSLLVADGHAVRAVRAPCEETAGVNDRVQLAAAHRVLNNRLLVEHMYAGVTVVDPASTWVDVGVVLAADVTLRPNVQLHGHTRIAAGATVGPDSTLTDTVVGASSDLQRVVAVGAVIGARTRIGPYVYLRPGTVLHDDVHVGTYVEIKNSEVGQGTKVPHLTYMGDADVGRDSNIGAATVFVNYDGAAKHRTAVGDHVFIGSDTMLIAPVSIADGAQTAAGSVITEDVPPGALAVARARQRNVDNWVDRKRPTSKAALAADAARTRPGGSAADQRLPDNLAADSIDAAQPAQPDANSRAQPDADSTAARRNRESPPSASKARSAE